MIYTEGFDMISVSILVAEDFGEEVYPTVRNILTDLIKYRDVRAITAGGSNDMIYRLLSDLAVEYPSVYFNILLSNNSLIVKQNDNLIDHLDIIVCRKSYSNYVHSRLVGRNFEIIAV